MQEWALGRDFYLLGFADKQCLLTDIEYDEEGYGPVAIRRSETVQPEKLQEAEKKILFIPSFTTGN